MFHGHKPINLLSKLINLGSGYVRAKVDNIPDLELISPDNVYVDWEIRLDTEESRESIEDILHFRFSIKIDIQELDKCLEANEGDNVESKNFNLLHLDRNSKDLTNSSFEKSAFVGKSFSMEIKIDLIFKMILLEARLILLVLRWILKSLIIW